MQERLNDISVMRCVAMILIIFYHCICPYGVWTNPDYSANMSYPIWTIAIDVLRNIHLPMFFIIAGYLFGHKRFMGGGYYNFMIFVKNKFMRVMLPYLIVGILIVVIQHEKLRNLLYGISHLWFLMTIFECYICGKLIDKVLWAAPKLKMLILLACFVWLILEDSLSVNIWGLTIRQFFQYFPYYLFGMILGTLNFFHDKKRRIIKLFIACLSFCVMVYIAFSNSNESLLKIVGFIFLTSLFFSIRECKNFRIPPFIKNLDLCSMGIYIVHHILIQKMDSLDYFHSLMTCHYILYPIFQFFVIFILSWYLVYLFKKYKYAKYILG